MNDNKSMEPKKTKQLQIRLSQEKKDEWKESAEQENETLSEFVVKSVEDRIGNLNSCSNIDCKNNDNRHCVGDDCLMNSSV